MGLQNPSETTMGLLSCVIGYNQYHDLEVGKMQQWFQFHQSMKSQLHAMLDRLRKVHGPKDCLLVALPEDPQCLYHLEVFSQEKPEKPRVSLEHLHHMADVLPLRKKHRYAGEDSTDTKDKTPMNLCPAGSHHMMQSQGFLQNAVMFANMFSGMKMALSPTKLSLLTGSSGSASTVQMVQPKSSNPTAASARPAACQQPLALEDAKESTKAVPAIEAPQPAEMQAPKPASTVQSPVVEDETKDNLATKESPVQKGGAGSSCNIPGLEAVAHIKAAMVSREESKNTTGLKRPASKMEAKEKVMKKPSATKIAAGTSKTKSVAKKSTSDFKGTVSQSQRHKWRPEGCSTCRYRRGCTDSCWIKRKYKPV